MGVVVSDLRGIGRQELFTRRREGAKKFGSRRNAETQRGRGKLDSRCVRGTLCVSASLREPSSFFFASSRLRVNQIKVSAVAEWVGVVA